MSKQRVSGPLLDGEERDGSLQPKLTELNSLDLAGVQGLAQYLSCFL